MEKITVAQVLAVVCVHLGVIAVVGAYCAAAGALFPRLTSHGAREVAGRLWLPMVLGVLISTPAIVGSYLLISRGGRVGAVGLALAGVWYLTGLIGCGGLARLIGRGGVVEEPDESSPLRAGFVGGMILALLWALPYVGWYVVMPLSIATGVGCVGLGVRGKRVDT